jgi:hypothetical protein
MLEDEEEAKKQKQHAMKGKHKEAMPENKLGRFGVCQEWAKRPTSFLGFGRVQGTQ